MAGNYPDAPSWRMAYDRDGTQGVWVNSGNVISDLTSTQLRNLNDESNANQYSVGTSGKLCLVFPELRDLDAMFIQFEETQSYSTPYGPVEVSSNTTNGLDGTWTSLGTVGFVKTSQVKPNFRTMIWSGTALAIRGIRWSTGASIQQGMVLYSWHLYGEPVPGANPNRLELWHPTLDEKLGPAALDWGDVPRNSSGDKTFRVKNLSGTQTASNIRVAMEALTDTTPSVVAQHTISYGGGAFLPQVNIGSLAPGAISGPVTLRRITPSNATLSLWTFRVFAESTEWA